MRKLAKADRPIQPSWAAPAAVLGLLVILASCGGGGGGSSVALGGGISGTGQAIGQIDAFGSIFLNGIRWDVSGASISIDDNPGAETDLGIGMVVQVEGDITPGSTEGVASRVSYDLSLRGPVNSLSFNADGNGILVGILGQDVRIEDGMTVFVDTDLGSIALSDVLEVSGFLDATGTLRATRARDRGTLVLGMTEVELRGTVQNYNGLDAFDIGSTSVQTTGTTDLSDLPGGVFNGRFVEVEGVLMSVDAIEATDLDAEATLAGDSGATSIEGFITDFVDLSSFRVQGVQVDASVASLTPLDPAAFANGTKVEVEGPSSGGILMADRLEARGGIIRIDAEVASAADIDLAASTVTLLGITISIDTSTLLDDKRDGVTGFWLGDVVAGDFLNIRGLEDGLGGVLATRLERDDTDDVILQGRVSGFNTTDETLTILGLVIPTDPATEFADELNVPFPSGAEFFALLGIGDLVRVRDREDGIETAIDVADDVEFELEN